MSPNKKVVFEILIVFFHADMTKKALETSKQGTSVGKHTTYRKNNNLEKCAGMGLNGFHIR